MATQTTTALFGGPLCGRALPTVRNEPYLWISTIRDEQRSLRAFKAPGKGILYRRAAVGEGMRPRTYIYAALTHRRCDACGSLQPSMGKCSFCGGVLLPT